MRFSARMQKRQWFVRRKDERAEELARQLKVSPLTAQTMLNRGISGHSEGQIFLNPRLVDLIEPARMPGIGAAIERIRQAIKQKEKITLYGDYDVDGITGVAILYELLVLLGAEVDYYIPHRIEEGYGLNDEAIRQLSGSGSRVLITVDCGITAKESAELAKKLGVDLIITDHHLFASQLPEAVAIVHPGLDKGYGNQHSAGAMVAFKLAWGLANEYKKGGEIDAALRQFLINATTLAAMGTIADVVDLRGENRIITSFGLKALPDSKLCGIKALIESAGLTGENLDSYHIGFCLAPMLNAAGRMGHARLAVELLTSDNEARSARISEYLKEQNRQRQQYERKIFKNACEMITTAGLDHPDRKSIVLASEDWHTGVIGIVASRIIDRYYRPTILFNSANGKSHGSGRSIPGFNLLEAISACSEHLVRFGGHAMAAGVTIETEKIGSFRDAMEEYTRRNLSEVNSVAQLEIDAEARVGEFNGRIVKELATLGPFGQGNPKPIFASRGVRIIAPPRKVGAKGEHLQLAISDNSGAIRCIGFGMGQLEKKLLEAEVFSVAYEPQINNYNGSQNVEFTLKDIQFEQE